MAPTSMTMMSRIPVARNGWIGVLSIYPPSTSTDHQYGRYISDIQFPLSDKGGRRPARVIEALTYRLKVSQILVLCPYQAYPDR